MIFSNIQPESTDNNWRHQLNKFIKAHQQELAALSWGLWLENGDSQGTIGIDLQPTPHFVYCPQAAIEKLNNNIENRLQELLGIVAHYQPEVEVLMIAIAKEQIKLIHYQPEIAPPLCFAQIGKDVDNLLEVLEESMVKELQVSQS